MKDRLTYEQIRRIDPTRFVDLEDTMRMLYDHGPNSRSQMEPVTPAEKTPSNIKAPQKQKKASPNIKTKPIFGTV
jgi:hypothetical protein